MSRTASATTATRTPRTTKIKTKATTTTTTTTTTTSPPQSNWLWTLLLTVRCALLLTPWLAHLLASNLILSALLPISTLLPDLCYDLSSSIAESVWVGIQTIFTRSNRAEIVVSGVETLPADGESAIVVANHVAWTDFYLVQQLALACGMLDRCRWFAKRQLRWVPFLGWGLVVMGMPLVGRKWLSDRREMDGVFRRLLRRRWPIWLISYSEGTRYTSAKRLEAEAWCKAYNKRLGRHVLYPRTKGFIACVQRLRTTTHVKAVYDVTIAYARFTDEGVAIFQSPPTFAQTVFTPRLNEQWRFFVHVDRHPLCDLPRTDEALAQWLEDRWVEKGERLGGLKERLPAGLPWSDLGSTDSTSAHDYATSSAVAG